MDGQTDITKLIVAFRSFADAPKVTEYERVILIRCRHNNKAVLIGLGRYLDGVIYKCYNEITRFVNAVCI